MKKRITSIFSDSNLKELVSKAGFFLVFRVLGFLFAYIFAIIVSKKYGADVYGLLTLGFTVIMVSSVIARLGFDINLTKLVALKAGIDFNTKGIFFKAITLNFIFASALGAIVYLFSEQIATRIFSNDNLTEYLKWAAITVPFWVIVTINSSVFRGLKMNNFFSFFNTFGRFLFSLIFLGLLIFYSDSSNGIISIKSHFFGVILLAIVSLLFIFKKLKKISFKSNISLNNFVVDSFPILMTASIVILLGWSDKIFLGIYEDEAKVGIYDLAFRISTLINFTLEAINSILAPKISQMYHNNERNKLQKTISFSAKLNAGLSFIVFLIIVLFPNFILGLIGEEFKQGVTILVILAASQLIGSLSGSVGVILNMTGHQKVYKNITLVTLVINVILNIILIKHYSILGAAIATSISIIVLNVSAALYIKHKLKITSYLVFNKP